MCRLARGAAPAIRIEGRTAVIGVPMITTPAELDAAAEIVDAFAESLAAPRRMHSSSAPFGDPALSGPCATRLPGGVASGKPPCARPRPTGGPLPWVTVTPTLVPSITAMAERLGLGRNSAA